MHQLEGKYDRAISPEDLAEFLGVAPDILMENASLSVGLEIVLSTFRYFRKKVREAVNSNQDIETKNLYVKKDVVKSPTPSEDTTAPTICFYQDGDYWIIGEIGKTQIFKQIKGFGFIHFVLLYPNKHLEAEIIYDCGVAPIDLKNDRKNNFRSMKELPEDVFQPMGKDYVPETDYKARRAYKIWIEDLERKLVGGNPEEILEMKEKIKQLKTFLSRKNRNIRTRNAENARTNVAKRMKEALQKIYANEAVASLKRYLNEATIKKGGRCIYQPDPNDKPHWVLHKNELPS
jgi:hypothetical protein